jgi:ribosomal protein S18 acetylase RimI-like enzyme
MSASVKRIELKFESEALGIPTARLELEATPIGAENLSDAVRREVATFEEAGLMLVTCRIPRADDAAAVLEANGFRRIEELVQLRQALPSAHRMPRDVRAATAEDRQCCIEIGRKSFSFDRFHTDPRITDESADELKARWVANAFDGRADKIFVADRGHGVEGFLLCMRRGATAVIDLIAVAPSKQGMGFGKALANAGLAYYSNLGADNMIVGTQAANLSSLAMYQALGFAEEARFYTCHWMPEQT